MITIQILTLSLHFWLRIAPPILLHLLLLCHYCPLNIYYSLTDLLLPPITITLKKTSLVETAVVVVTVENTRAAEVENGNDVVFVAGMLGIELPKDALEGGFSNEKLEVLEGAAEVTTVGIDGLANAEGLEKKKPKEEDDDDEENNGAGLELGAEPEEKGLESEGLDEAEKPNNMNQEMQKK